MTLSKKNGSLKFSPGLTTTRCGLPNWVTIACWVWSTTNTEVEGAGNDEAGNADKAGLRAISVLPVWPGGG
jgi:hypothetical protein